MDYSCSEDRSRSITGQEASCSEETDMLECEREHVSESSVLNFGKSISPGAVEESIC